MRAIAKFRLNQFGKILFIFLFLFDCSCHRKITMPSDISGTYVGRLQSIEELIELSENGTFVHKVFFGASCELEERGHYSVGFCCVTLQGFSKFIDFDVLLKGVCRTNGVYYVHNEMIYIPGKIDGGGVIKPSDNFEFCYRRISTNEWLTRSGPLRACDK